MIHNVKIEYYTVTRCKPYDNYVGIRCPIKLSFKLTAILSIERLY